MKVVIDASVAVKWVLPEAGSDAAAALSGEDLFAPAWWLAEVSNVLWHNTMRGYLTPEEAGLLLAELQSAPVASVPVDRDIGSALALATELRHPVYDCIYLALALREGAVLVTADRRFHTTVSGSRYRDAVRLLAG